MDNQHQPKLSELLNDFDTAVLVTHAERKIHARPMRVVSIEGSQIVFVTGINSSKADEIAANPDIGLIFQASKKHVVVNGKATIIKNRVLIDELWSETWRVWFPQGKDDPNICLISITANEAEYWDNSGIEGLKYIFSAAAAYFKGQTPDIDNEQHGKLKLG